MSASNVAKVSSQPKPPRKRNRTKYNDRYKEKFSWVGPSTKGEDFAFCKWCDASISIGANGSKALRNHEHTRRHLLSSASRPLEEHEHEIFQNHLDSPIRDVSPHQKINIVGLLDVCQQSLSSGVGTSGIKSERASPEPYIRSYTPDLGTNDESEEPTFDDSESSQTPNNPTAQESNTDDDTPPTDVKIKYGTGAVIYSTPPNQSSKISTDNKEKDTMKNTAITWKRKKPKQSKLEIKYELGSNLTCDICGSEFDEWQLFKTHLADHIKEAHQKQQVTIRDKILPKASTASKKIKTEVTSDDEEINVAPLESSKELNIATLASVATVLEDGILNANKIIQQEIEAQMFKNESNPNSTVEVASEDVNNTCKGCNEVLPNKEELEEHLMSLHTIECPNQMFLCSICNKTLTSKSNIRIHVKDIHMGEKPFECPICRKKFSRKANMEMHMVYHTGIRPYPCDICGQSFFSVNAQKRHLKLHTGIREHECDICGANYVTSTDLKTHKIKHLKDKPFPCNLCDRQFARNYDLKIHMKYHNNDAQYTCFICEKSFVQSGNYKKHMKKHSGDDGPFTCKICQASYSLITHFIIHVEASHPQESNELIRKSVDDANKPAKRYKANRKSRLKNSKLTSPISQDDEDKEATIDSDTSS